MDLVHDLRADARRRQAGPARYCTARYFRYEHFLQRNRLVVQPRKLGNAEDFSPPVGQPSDMDHEVDRAADLLPDSAYREFEPGHQHHGLEAGERIPGAIRVDGGDGAAVSGVHRL
jgi:hypothetical protein